MQRYQKGLMHTKLEGTLAAHEEGFVIPLNRMPNHGKDLFSVLPRPLSAQECFLFDYCTFKSLLFTTRVQYKVLASSFL